MLVACDASLVERALGERHAKMWTSLLKCSDAIHLSHNDDVGAESPLTVQGGLNDAHHTLFEITCFHYSDPWIIGLILLVIPGIILL